MPATVIDFPLSSNVTGWDLERVIAQPLQLLDNNDTPLLNLLGGLNGAANWGFNALGTKVEWMQDEYNALTGLFDAAGYAADATALTLVDASHIENRNLIRVDATGELLWVSAVNKTTNVITVTRGWGASEGGIAAGSIAASAKYTIVGIAKLEGDDYYDAGSTLPWSNWNYTQIYERKYGLSGTLKEVPGQLIGIADPMAREQMRTMRDIMLELENDLTYGIRSPNRGTAALPRTFGGYPFFIKTNVQSASTFTLVQLNAMITEVVGWGATNPVVVASPKQYSLIKTFLAAQGNFYVPLTTTEIGYQVTSIDADFGTLKIVKNIHQPNTIMPILNLPDVGLLTIRPLRDEDLPKTKDAYEHSMLTELTFCLRNEKRFALFTGLSF